MSVSNLYFQESDIMVRFNFARVLKAMTALDWTWAGQEVTEDQLRSTAFEMLSSVIDEYLKKPQPWISARSGGFEAKVQETKWGPQLSLVFAVDSIASGVL